jgi:hypothetical protein
MGEELSYYAKMLLQEFIDRYGDDLRAGFRINISALKDLVPVSQRESVLKELLSDHEYIEMIEDRFPGKLILTHKGYHFLMSIDKEHTP